MAGPVLQITVGANVAAGVAGLQSLGAAGTTAAAGLNATGTAATNAGRGLNALAPAIRPNLQGLTLLGTSGQAAARGLNALSPFVRPQFLSQLQFLGVAANQSSAGIGTLATRGRAAGGALTDFGRVIQDSPFGIIGIANNITQLSESFGRLVTQTGSTGAALRAFGSSIFSVGGIGLAISILTTVLQFASIGFGAWTRGFTGGKKAMEDAAKAAKEFADNLKSVNDVVGQSTGGVQGEIVRIQALASVITNTNSAYEQRKRALTELQQINKAYFGNLKLEEDQMGTLTAKVNEYVKSLVNQAVVKGFETELGKVSTGLYDQEKALKKAEDGYKRLRSELDATKQTTTSATGEERVTERYVTLTKEVAKAKKVFEEQREVVTKGRESFVQLKDAMGAAVIAGLAFADTTNVATKKTKEEDATLKSLRKELAGYERQLKDIDELRKGGVLPINFEDDALALQQKIFDTLGKIDAREVAIKVKPELEINPKVLDLQIDQAIKEANVRSGSKPFIPVIRKIKPLFVAEFSPADKILGGNLIPDTAFDPVIEAIRKNAKARLEGIGPTLQEAFAETVAKSLQEGIVSAADILGSAFGDIISGDFAEGLANAASGLLGVIGGILQEVGKQIIVTSTLIQALKKTLSTLFANPLAGVGIGLALVALGGLLKNINIKGFANGVTGFQGGTALVGEDGPELVRLPTGSDVIPNNRLGEFNGSGSMIVGETTIYGSDLRTVLIKENARKRRI